jgi:hypothetical protein
VKLIIAVVKSPCHSLTGSEPKDLFSRGIWEQLTFGRNLLLWRMEAQAQYPSFLIGGVISPRRRMAGHLHIVRLGDRLRPYFNSDGAFAAGTVSRCTWRMSSAREK